jgi:DNA-binding ferritin-like protein
VNFEVLRNTTTGNVDMSLFSTYTSVQAAANGSGFTNMTAGQANAVTIRTAGGTDTGATFALASAANKQRIADFVAGRIDAHDKHSWFLRASAKK